MLTGPARHGPTGLSCCGDLSVFLKCATRGLGTSFSPHSDPGPSAHLLRAPQLPLGDTNVGSDHIFLQLPGYRLARQLHEGRETISFSLACTSTPTPGVNTLFLNKYLCLQGKGEGSLGGKPCCGSHPHPPSSPSDLGRVTG